VARKKLGKYEIVDRIGRGGMAEVYRGYHAALDRYVAIKLLHPFLADDPEFKDRFENEARNVAKLKHPGIVQVYDFEYDAEGESYYMVMELINGPTLKDQLFELATANDRYPISEAIRIVRSAAEALAYAHQRNMIHRDVKPANLMIDEDNRLVLTDFGIAKIVTGNQFTATGGMVGTPAYMSPEQGMGEAGDERSDIYSMGVILYQIITGQLPFDAESPLAVILKHVNEPLPLPSVIAPEIVTQELEHITCKALAKEPEERYQNAAAMADDLAQLDETGRLRPRYDTPIRLAADPSKDTYDTPLLTPEDVQRAAPSLASKTSPTKPPGLAEAIAMQDLEIEDQPSRRLRPAWVLALAASLILVGAAALLALGGDGTVFGGLFGSDDDTSTPPAAIAQSGTEGVQATDGSQTAAPTSRTASPRPSPTNGIVPELPPSTTTHTPTATNTPTPTATVTDTPTPTLSPTPTSTQTPTANLTGTAAAEFYETQVAATPTPNMTQTLSACDFDYIVVIPDNHTQPPQPASDPL
jgi:serine/threonine protein kinase